MDAKELFVTSVKSICVKLSSTYIVFPSCFNISVDVIDFKLVSFDFFSNVNVCSSILPSSAFALIVTIVFSATVSTSTSFPAST